MKKLTVALLTLVVATSSAASAKVLAEVNGKKITDKDLNAAIDSLPPQYHTLKNNPTFRKRMLENLVKEELLYQEALKEGLENDPAFKRRLEQIKKRLLVQYLLSKHVKPPKVEVTKKEAKAFYEKNKKMFTDATGKQVPFSAVEPFIMENLKRQKEQEALNRAVENYVKNLEAHAKVKIYGSSGSAK
ncbi:SurA N-terminal domain-containing protein [Thermovibrio ammonificans]|uniref:peptidylprolyl isomerase n=1 Tax=Thermovibrio ammonificans (strain DSM 15698 / JCM 12110 / HB-1) TaxID=648996 RepID=E8T1Y8_THEA1|nr:SurA N-terminal domain-containing protein [Thermovibrio ammonificans]ADU96883.1 hypothetical protein Theam_0916 [Thermovibrio ammonificans HB-1]